MRKPFRPIVKRPKVIFLSDVARKVRSASVLKQDHLKILKEECLNSMSTFEDSPFAASESGEKIQEINDQNGDILDPEEEHLFPKTLEVTEEHQPSVPDLFTHLPPIRDSLQTTTSLLQDETAQECLPCHAGTNDTRVGFQHFNSRGLPVLLRQEHVEFLHDSLNKLPAGFVVYDSSRPWLVHWALTGLCLLGEDISPYRRRVIQTFTPMQNHDGGFGGGHGQMSHCAPTYAAVLSLAMLGEPEALDLIDRRSLWKWLGEIKQSDGGFAVCKGAEVDVRGAYCAMVMISLLNLPLELPQDSPARAQGIKSFLDGLPQWLSRCQTYEGGLAGAPSTEAHGAYAFCALACMCIIGCPKDILPKYLDLPLLTSWISARQYSPEGGFAGRTNKLVDACYSHWVGGCWPFIEAAYQTYDPDDQGRGQFTGSLYHREGLIRYILCCSQHNEGGFRDKPSKHVDAYHSCYALAGLSSAQYRQTFKSSLLSEEEGPLDAAFQWRPPKENQAINRSDEEDTSNEQNMLKPIHPIFVIPYADVERTRSWFLAKGGF